MYVEYTPFIFCIRNFNSQWLNSPACAGVPDLVGNPNRFSRGAAQIVLFVVGSKNIVAERARRSVFKFGKYAQGWKTDLHENTHGRAYIPLFMCAVHVNNSCRLGFHVPPTGNNVMYDKYSTCI